jgi:hypothetical protein
MLDREPWQPGDDLPPPRPPRLLRRLRIWWQRRQDRTAPTIPDLPEAEKPPEVASKPRPRKQPKA